MQCKSDLRSDEEIFAEKARELSALQENQAHLEADNTQLAQRLEETEETIKQLEEQLLSKQMELEQMASKLKVNIKMFARRSRK